MKWQQGTIVSHKSKDGKRWRIFWHDNNQKRKSKVILGPKSVARKELNKVITKLETGEYVDNPNITFNDFVEIFLKVKRTENLAHATIREYERFFTVDPSVIKNLNNKNLAKITAADCLNIIEDATKRNSLSMARHAFTYLNTFFNQALKMDYIISNPMMKLKKPRLTKPDKKAMTTAEWVKFYKAIDDEWEKVYFRIMVSTAMRRGEVCALKISDINLKEKFITILRSYSVINGKHIFTDTKNHQSTNMPIDEETISLIKAHVANLSILALRMDRTLNSDDYLFPNPYLVGLGKDSIPMHPDSWSKRFKKICQKAKLDRKFTLHEIRHTTATFLIVDLKLDPLTVSQRLRHADRGFTLNQYAHLYGDSQKEATNKLGELLK